MHKVFLLSLLLTLVLLSCQSNKSSDTQKSDRDHSSFSENTQLKNIYAKRIILSCTSSDLNDVDSLVEWIIHVQPGGIIFSDWTIGEIQNLGIRLDSLIDAKPLFFANYFELMDHDPYPIWGANPLFQDSVYLKVFQVAGVNSFIIPKDVYCEMKSRKYLNTIGEEFQIYPSYKVRANRLNLKGLERIATALQGSNGFLWIDSVGVDSLPYHKIKKALNFKGLLITNALGNPMKHLNSGADMVVISNRTMFSENSYQVSNHAKMAYKAIIKVLKIQKTTSDNLSAKALLLGGKLHFQAKSTAIFNKANQFLPLKKYKNVRLSTFLNQKKTRKNQIVIVPKNTPDSTLKKIVLCPNIDRTLVVFSKQTDYLFLKSVPNLLFSSIYNNKVGKVLESQISGQIPINGNLIVNSKIKKGKKINGKGMINLPPEYAFINSDILSSIHFIISAAIEGKAFPGCQILAVKDNVIIYNKAIGHTNYQKDIALNQQHIYDLASLTKVLSTTLVAMKLWEDDHFKLDDKIEQYLPDSLSKYLPNGSSLKEITFQELLTHKSGLPAGFPVVKYMRKAANLETRFSNGFCDYSYDNYKTEVAQDLYLENTFQDSMWLTLNSMWLDPNKEYKYSDVNMNLLYFILSDIIKDKQLVSDSRKGSNVFEMFLYAHFYTPLNMLTTKFKPLKRFTKKRIVPTEHDRFWRKQLLQGHVHDPNAALYGGIAGNAGLFSNASDLGILLTMWQNKGVFEGKRYLKEETIKKFSEAQPGTHRGLGFNKRTFANNAYAMATSAASSSYGHTGFTGTCFWIDPETKISYVFLSNRVHPKVSNKIYEFNVRARVHQVFYDAMLK